MMDVDFVSIFIKKEIEDNVEHKNIDSEVKSIKQIKEVRKHKAVKHKSENKQIEMSNDNKKCNKLLDENVSDGLKSEIKLKRNKMKVKYKNKTNEKEQDMAPYLCEVIEEDIPDSNQQPGEKPFHCTECPKTFLRQSSLKLHLRTHSGEKPYCCAECGKKFSQVSNLKKHELTHFGIKPFQCLQCFKNFANRQNLKVHERIHSDNKPYQCKECSKAFSQLSNLKHHMLAHTGQKPFQCKECLKQFTQVSNLKQHVLTHTGTRPFQCKECFKRFSRITHLKQHMLTHTGERPFECDICLRKFSQHSILKRHVQTHSGLKSHECKECGKKFTRSFALNKHLVQTHFGQKYVKVSQVKELVSAQNDQSFAPSLSRGEQIEQFSSLEEPQFNERLLVNNDSSSSERARKLSSQKELVSAQNEDGFAPSLSQGGQIEQFSSLEEPRFNERLLRNNDFSSSERARKLSSQIFLSPSFAVEKQAKQFNENLLQGAQKAKMTEKNSNFSIEKHLNENLLQTTQILENKTFEINKIKSFQGALDFSSVTKKFSENSSKIF